MHTPLVAVMPVYNEAECLADVVAEWVEPLRVVRGLLLLVDDGSTDATPQVLASLRERFFPTVRLMHQKNQGHGAAVRAGYERALTHYSADWVFQTDSDGQFPASAFPDLWAAHLGHPRAKLVVGHRAVRHDPLVRLIITRLLRWSLLLGFGLAVPDANCPYRLLEGRWLGRALPRIPRDTFAPNIFLSLLAAREGVLHSMEIPHVARQTGSVTINRRLLSVCARNVSDLIRFHTMLGKGQ